MVLNVVSKDVLKQSLVIEFHSKLIRVITRLRDTVRVIKVELQLKTVLLCVADKLPAKPKLCLAFLSRVKVVYADLDARHLDLVKDHRAVLD